MTDITNHCECDFFSEGDWVECKLNTDQFGIVVSSSDWGRFYNVQLAGSMEIKTFYGVTLRHINTQEDEPLTGKQAAVVDDDNVIDFTKERELRNTTTTRGAA